MFPRLDCFKNWRKTMRQIAASDLPVMYYINLPSVCIPISRLKKYSMHSTVCVYSALYIIAYSY